MVGSFYDVRCCYVENGPCLFSVHLKSTLQDLDTMTNELEKYDLKNLEERPSLGMACIARFSEDNQLYRAVIMDIKPTQCQVAYVDYGNTEYVSFSDIYEIPPVFLEPKIFAIRFALSGYKELEPINDNIKKKFKQTVLQQDLRLKVMPLEGPPLVQYCELYNSTNSNVLKYLKRIYFRKYEYQMTADLLKSGDMVVIRYIESPKNFFVQKVQNIHLFDIMMDNLYLCCTKKVTQLSNLEKGAACAVKFENAWYRAEIVEIEQNNVIVRHIDFGNEREVSVDELAIISDDFIKFPPQAIPCCLKGFENSETVNESAIAQLEMLAEGNNRDRRHFKCQVFDINDNIAIVNLIDETIRPELNLMKKLYKLSMPFNKYIGLEKEGGLDGGVGVNEFPHNLQQQQSKTSSWNNENHIPQYDQRNTNTTEITTVDDWEFNSNEVKDVSFSRDNRQSKRSNNSNTFKEHNKR